MPSTRRMASGTNGTKTKVNTSQGRKEWGWVVLALVGDSRLVALE